MALAAVVNDVKVRRAWRLKVKELGKSGKSFLSEHWLKTGSIGWIGLIGSVGWQRCSNRSLRQRSGQAHCSIGCAS